MNSSPKNGATVLKLAVTWVVKAFVNVWFLVLSASLILSYLILFPTMEKVRRLQAVSVSIYSNLDRKLVPLMTIADGEIAFELPRDRAKPADEEVNIFVGGTTLGSCSDYQRQRQIEPVLVKEFLAFPTQSRPLYRIKTTQFSSIHCKAPNIPSKTAYSERAIDLQLVEILPTDGNRQSTALQGMGEAAGSIELGFPFTDASDFAVIFGGLPSQYEDPTEAELASATRDNPLLTMGPTKRRVTLAEVPRVVARWNSPDAKDRRDMLFLIVGVILGIGGAAAIEWVKSLKP